MLTFLQAAKQAAETGKAFKHTDWCEKEFCSHSPDMIVPAENFWSKHNKKAAEANGGTLHVLGSISYCNGLTVEMGYIPEVSEANSPVWVMLD